MDNPEDKVYAPDGVEMRPGPKGGLLKIGGRNPNAGRPPSKLRGRAGRLFDEVMGEFEEALKKHKSGEQTLTVSELATISKETRPVSVAELKSVSLDGTAQIDAALDTIQEFWQDQELDPALCIGLVGMILERLTDQ